MEVVTIVSRPRPYIIADSFNDATKDRLTTVVIPCFWKLLQAQLRTHRSFSQSHYSSRAVPTDKVLEQVKTDPFIPQWTAHQPGMTGSDTLDEYEKEKLTKRCLDGRNEMVKIVSSMKLWGAAKQEANRYIEPWAYGPVVISGTDYAWEHFFKLRCKDDVQPDFRDDARYIRDLYNASKPKVLYPGDWHIPFQDETTAELPHKDLIKVSAARCARISYRNFHGNFSIEKDMKLFDDLVAEEHMTPLEHQALATKIPIRFRNIDGFIHQRHILEDKVFLD